MKKVLIIAVAIIAVVTTIGTLLLLKESNT